MCIDNVRHDPHSLSTAVVSELELCLLSSVVLGHLNGSQYFICVQDTWCFDKEECLELYRIHAVVLNTIVEKSPSNSSLFFLFLQKNYLPPLGGDGHNIYTPAIFTGC